MAAPSPDDALREACRVYLEGKTQISLVRLVVGKDDPEKSIASGFSRFFSKNKRLSKKWDVLGLRQRLQEIVTPPLPAPRARALVLPSLTPPSPSPCPSPGPLSPRPSAAASVRPVAILPPSPPSLDIASERVRALADRVKCVYLFFDGSYLTSPMTLDQFVKGIFYVGQGNTSRPRDHVREAGSAQPRSAVAQYVRGMGSVSLHRTLWLHLSEDQSFTAEHKLLEALREHGKHFHLASLGHHCGVTGQRRTHSTCLANRVGGSDRSSRLPSTDLFRTRSAEDILQLAFDTFCMFL